MTALNTADLDAVVKLITDTGVRADTDPTKVHPPAAWVRFDGFDYDVRDESAALHLTVHLIVPARDPRRSLDDLAELFDEITPALAPLGGPEGPVAVTGVVLPGSSTPLPALAVPLDVHTSN